MGRANIRWTNIFHALQEQWGTERTLNKEVLLSSPTLPWGFPSGSLVKNCPPMQETLVWSLGWEDPLEKEMATHSSILARIILWTKEPCGLQSLGSQRGGHNWATGHAHTCIHNSRYSIFSLWIRKQFREIKPLYMSKPGLKLKCDSQCCAVTMMLRCLFTQ